MLLEISIAALALLLGILAGTITGLIPGIHINLIAIILISSLAALDFLPLTILIVFIVSLAITHTFLDFIPAIFLGAPEEDTFLSILPGHQMLKEGRAYEAIILTLYGSMVALAIILIFTPLFIYLIPTIFNISQLLLPFLLIFISLYLMLRERQILLSLVIFILAGFLGFATLNLPIKQPLLPLLTGLFGSSALIVSIKDKISISPQETLPLKKIKLSKKELIHSSLAAIISAPLCSFLPGVGAGHAAVIGSELFPQSRKGFLFLLGTINTIVIGLSFITLFVIGRTRTGAAVAINQITQPLTLSNLITIITTVILSGLIAFFLAIKISKLVAKNISKINYTKLSYSILFILLLITIIFSNFLGMIVFITSTALGVFTILSGARRINLMGSLLIPVILFYLF